MRRFAFLFALFFLFVPAGVYAQGQTVVLSENGVGVTVTLPAGSVVESQFDSNHTIISMGDVQVVLEIMDGTVDKQIDFERRVYEGLKGDNPEMTLLEEMPNIDTDTGSFAVYKLRYPDVYDNATFRFTAFCTLNYRYIYHITLRGDDVDYEMLRPFTSAVVETLPFRPDPVPSVIAVLFAIIGLGILLNEFKAKHSWPRTTGVVVDCIRHRRSADVVISYRKMNGEKAMGSYNMTWGFFFYTRHKDKTIEISYSENHPQKVNILSAKGTYRWGAAFLCLAIFFVYLMFFQL